MKKFYMVLWAMWLIINFPLLQYVKFIRFISREMIRESEPKRYEKLLHIEKLKKEI